MFSIPNRALSWAITSFGNKFCLKKRSRLIKALDNRFYVKFMQLEIGLLTNFYCPTFQNSLSAFRGNKILVKSVQSTLSHLITASVPLAMFTHFLVKHGLCQYYLYLIDLPGG